MSNKTPSNERVEGRVAQILNARELVINIGSSHGVALGMKFAILSESPLEVKDPTNGEVLDVIDREKVRVSASEVREKITICRTYRVHKIPGGPLYGFANVSFSEITKPPSAIPETLAAKDKDLPPPLSPDESYVKINDRVIHIRED